VNAVELSWPTIGAFLKEHRRLIPREATALGPYPRLPVRRGKLVTQEEIAEAIGVSRVWYAMLESGAALRASPKLLTRLASALSLPAESREMLFRLALPKLSVGGSALGALKDLSSSITPLRTAARRVWSATSESEILVTVAEAVNDLFADADFVGAFTRVEPGQWDYPVVIGGDHWEGRLTELRHELNDGLHPVQIDEAMLHTVLTEPGQVGTRRELHRNLTVKHRIDTAFRSVGFEAATFLKAHVKSREGFEATIFAHYMAGDKDFSELDRSLLGALADLASVALARHVTS
jgi:transcriptional regulator with XRE-family HTH domain